MLKQKLSPNFKRDVKRLKKKNINMQPLKEVIALICKNDTDSINELVRRHNIHRLKGNLAGNLECHVANAGDWLLIWCVVGEFAVFQRTGSHDELFK